jgi:hypothetical protein
MRITILLAYTIETAVLGFGNLLTKMSGLATVVVDIKAPQSVKLKNSSYRDPAATTNATIKRKVRTSLLREAISLSRCCINEAKNKKPNMKIKVIGLNWTNVIRAISSLTNCSPYTADVGCFVMK